MFDADDTIAAVASAPGGSLRGIVRVSGSQALACVRGLVDDHAARQLAALHAPAVVSAQLHLAEFAAPVPGELYVWPGVRSYTRLPTVELHLPGAAPILDAALAALGRRGARPAKPGEFTMRAFLAGRIDLTQAEAVLGVIDAADRRQLQTALKQMAGGLAGPLDGLRNDLLDLTAHLEAGLDFVEEDIEFVSRDELLRQLANADHVVGGLLEQMCGRGEAAEFPRVALVGLPNVGKSSLFNALAGNAQALVSPAAGTTRDYLLARLALGGALLELIDTAGIATAPEHDAVDKAAQRHSVEQSEDAHLTLLCLDASRPPTAWELQRRCARNRQLVVWTKSDLPPHPEAAAAAQAGDLHVSTIESAGLERLSAAITQALIASAAAQGDVVATTAVRCRDSLHRAQQALERAAQLVRERRGEELAAAELRAALDELGQIVGAVYTDDILDRIFSRFCIGK